MITRLPKPKRKPEPVYRDQPLCSILARNDACTRAFPERTPYFYRATAISFARKSRCRRDRATGYAEIAASIAKQYLRRYRESLAEWAQAINAGGAL